MKIYDKISLHTAGRPGMFSWNNSSSVHTLRCIPTVRLIGTHNLSNWQNSSYPKLSSSPSPLILDGFILYHVLQAPKGLRPYWFPGRGAGLSMVLKELARVIVRNLAELVCQSLTFSGPTSEWQTLFIFSSFKGSACGYRWSCRPITLKFGTENVMKRVFPNQILRLRCELLVYLSPDNYTERDLCWPAGSHF